MAERRAGLAAYLNRVLQMLPGDKEISMFLAFDGSVDDETAASFGLESNFYERQPAAAAADSRSPVPPVLLEEAAPRQLMELSVDEAAAAVARRLGLGPAVETLGAEEFVQLAEAQVFGGRAVNPAPFDLVLQGSGDSGAAPADPTKLQLHRLCLELQIETGWETEDYGDW